MKITYSLLILSFSILLNCQIFESVGSISTSMNGISTSSNSISKLSDSVQSISGSLQSVSGSSSGAGKSQMQVYCMDIRDLTVIYAKTGFNKEYTTDLSQLARKNGILNWESNPTTYFGIGQGLKKAQINEYEFNTFLREIDSKRENLRDFLSEGYYSF